MTNVNEQRDNEFRFGENDFRMLEFLKINRTKSYEHIL